MSFYDNENEKGINEIMFQFMNGLEECSQLMNNSHTSWKSDDE